MTRCTRHNIMWSTFSVTCGRSVVSTTNKTYHHDIIEILFKKTLNTITLTQISNIFLVVVVGGRCKENISTMSNVSLFSFIYSSQNHLVPRHILCLSWAKTCIFNVICLGSVFFVFGESMKIGFVDIDRLADHHCLNVLFLKFIFCEMLSWI